MINKVRERFGLQGQFQIESNVSLMEKADWLDF